jgi:hypothetical protein
MSDCASYESLQAKHWPNIEAVYFQKGQNTANSAMSTGTFSRDQNVDDATHARNTPVPQKRARVQLSCTSCRHAKYAGPEDPYIYYEFANYVDSNEHI